MRAPAFASIWPCRNLRQILQEDTLLRDETEFVQSFAAGGFRLWPGARQCGAGYSVPAMN